MKPIRTKSTMLIIAALILIIISAIADTSITHSTHDLWYYTFFIILLVGISNLAIGIKMMRDAKKIGQPRIWYKEVNINLGCMVLTLGLFELLIKVASPLPNAIGDTLVYISIVVLGIPFLIFFFLLCKYRPQQQR